MDDFRAYVQLEKNKENLTLLDLKGGLIAEPNRQNVQKVFDMIPMIRFSISVYLRIKRICDQKIRHNRTPE